MQIQQAKDQNKKAEAKKKELEEFIARFSANASKEMCIRDSFITDNSEVRM